MAKKIINNRMYNTETAKQLGYWSNGYTPSDFYFAEETLYQKKTGEYFLVGHGGPMSSYAESCAGQLLIRLPKKMLKNGQWIV